MAVRQAVFENGDRFHQVGHNDLICWRVDGEIDWCGGSAVGAEPLETGRFECVDDNLVKWLAE